MRNSFFRSLFLVSSAVCLAFAGCSGDKLPAKVRGEVTVDGQPLAAGTIIFAVPGKPEATGKIENGKIVSVGTFDTDDGASPGQAQVAVQAIQITALPAVVSDPGDTKTNTLSSMSGTSLIPAHYNNPTTSNLTADLKAGPNEPKFDLKSK
jgi:hypothetical protein